MLTYLKTLAAEARTKVTTYLALGVAGVSQVAAHAQEIHDQLPELQGYLPQGPMIAKGAHIVTTGLGFLIVWSRVRRIIAPQKTP